MAPPGPGGLALAEGINAYESCPMIPAKSDCNALTEDWVDNGLGFVSGAVDGSDGGC